jgi:diaminopimelate epimerase
MGSPRLRPAEIPAVGWNELKVVEQPLQVADRRFHVSLVSMGNPHCVIAVGPEWRLEDTCYWGPQIEQHPAFPRRTNVEFVWFENPAQAHVSVWERGAGATRACGTGACATLVVGVLTDRLRERAHIQLPGGSLWIEWTDPQQPVYMTGPARLVFSGLYEITPDEIEEKPHE